MKRILSSLSLVVLAGVALTGCAGLGGPDVSDTHFADDAEALNSSKAANIPGFLPLDATDVDLAVRSSAPGSQLHWTSEGGITATYCEPGPITGSPSDLGVDWWPGSVPAEGYDCGRWMAFEADGAFYAWDTKE